MSVFRSAGGGSRMSWIEDFRGSQLVLRTHPHIVCFEVALIIKYPHPI